MDPPLAPFPPLPSPQARRRARRPVARTLRRLRLNYPTLHRLPLPNLPTPTRPRRPYHPRALSCRP
ncbi:hypothetical protein LINPERPRIM_LOCUS11526 [Linum perenne]